MGFCRMRLSRRAFCSSSASLGAGLLLAPRQGLAHELSAAPLTRFAFGSCNRQDEAQHHWQTILATAPEGWLWMGDAIYADDYSASERANAYRSLQDVVAYRELATRGFLLGTWDDHDYGNNNAGGDYRDKDNSQRVFLDFLGEPADSPRRRRRGVYDARMIGEADVAVQFVLLDMRYFKARAGREADPLGREQWAWLEREFAKPAALRVVVSSIQVLTDFTRKDTWAQYPVARSRLFQLLAASSCPVVLASGDRHMSEISRRELVPGKYVHEFTSSGLTHCSDRGNDNPYRLGEQIFERNFGVMELEWSGRSLRRIEVTTRKPGSGETLDGLTFAAS